MKDAVTLAYINMYGILGALEDLCRFSPEAKELVSARALPGKKPLAIGFTIRGGPAMVLRFEDGSCTLLEGRDPCDIRLPFGSFGKFNGLIDGTATPIPAKGFTKIGFLTKNFVRLTAILETYLRASREALADEDFFNASTTIMFFLISRAVVQIANHDRIGSFTASNVPDSTVLLSIAGGPQAAITIKDHHFSFSRIIPESCHAIMEFSSMDLARQLFDGKVSALGCVGQGLIAMRGNLGILDNINRILDRVALYLA
ncbi:MAG: hypothetical protein LBF77_07970 [Spirochaetaceae bacterium]|jgi:hypothetical protein|nr:hypothetical protein [Spirochaetaceae bacterium]